MNTSESMPPFLEKGRHTAPLRIVGVYFSPAGSGFGWSKSAQQVPAPSKALLALQPTEKTGHRTAQGEVALVPDTLCVRHARLKKVATHTKRRGGWQPTARLSWQDVKQIDAIHHAMRRARLPPTHLVTIRGPSDVSDAQSKRFISKRLSHLGTALKRRGQEHFGITTFEKAPELHAHHLVHIRSENTDVIQRFADGETIHQRKAVLSDISYMTKQRKWLGPEFERRLRRTGMGWQRSSGSVPGRRWSATGPARALVKTKEGVAARPSLTPSLRPCP